MNMHLYITVTKNNKQPEGGYPQALFKLLEQIGLNNKIQLCPAVHEIEI